MHALDLEGGGPRHGEAGIDQGRTSLLGKDLAGDRPRCGTGGRIGEGRMAVQIGQLRRGRFLHIG